VQGRPTYFISACDQVSVPQGAVLPSADCGAGAAQGTPTYFISACDQVSVPHAGVGVCALADVIANVAPHNAATANAEKESMRTMIFPLFGENSKRTLIFSIVRNPRTEVR
jgi:hypothetical protein